MCGAHYSREKIPPSKFHQRDLDPSCLEVGGLNSREMGICFNGDQRKKQIISYWSSILLTIWTTPKLVNYILAYVEGDWVSIGQNGEFVWEWVWVMSREILPSFQVSFKGPQVDIGCLVWGSQFMWDGMLLTGHCFLVEKTNHHLLVTSSFDYNINHWEEQPRAW